MTRTSVRRVSVNYAALSPNMSQLNISGTDTLKRQGRKIGYVDQRVYPCVKIYNYHSSDMGRRLMRTSISGPSTPRGATSPNPSYLGGSDDNPSFEPSDDRDTANYHTLLDAFIVLLRRDRELLSYVFPVDLQSSVFTKLIELPLVYMREEAQRLCDSVERIPKKLDAGKSSIFGIFSILRWFLKSRPTFAKLFQVKYSQLDEDISKEMRMISFFQESDVTRRQQFTTFSATFERAVMIEYRSFPVRIRSSSLSFRQQTIFELFVKKSSPIHLL